MATYILVDEQMANLLQTEEDMKPAAEINIIKQFKVRDTAAKVGGNLRGQLPRVDELYSMCRPESRAGQRAQRC